MSRAGWLRLAVILGAVLLLELACRTGAISRLTVIPPSEMLTALIDLLGQAAVWHHILVSFQNIAISFALSLVFGFLFGVGLHALPRIRQALDPVLASYYAVPFFVFYPLFIIIFGLNAWPLIAIAFLFAVVAMVINTLNGLDRVPRVLLKVAQVHHLSAWQRIRLVLLPATAPYLFTGAKLALAYSFIGVLAGEFILSSAGLGYAISYAYDGFDNQTMYGLLLFVLALVAIMNTGLHVWERRLMHRRER